MACHSNARAGPQQNICARPQISMRALIKQIIRALGRRICSKLKIFASLVLLADNRAGFNRNDSMIISFFFKNFDAQNSRAHKMWSWKKLRAMFQDLHNRSSTKRIPPPPSPHTLVKSSIVPTKESWDRKIEKTETQIDTKWMSFHKKTCKKEVNN